MVAYKGKACLPCLTSESHPMSIYHQSTSFWFQSSGLTRFNHSFLIFQKLMEIALTVTPDVFAFSQITLIIIILSRISQADHKFCVAD